MPKKTIIDDSTSVVIDGKSYQVCQDRPQNIFNDLNMIAKTWRDIKSNMKYIDLYYDMYDKKLSNIYDDAKNDKVIEERFESIQKIRKDIDDTKIQNETNINTFVKHCENLIKFFLKDKADEVLSKYENIDLLYPVELCCEKNAFIKPFFLKTKESMSVDK